jgi:hypothetical protein
MSIYEKLKAAGVKMDSHESDLYIEATPQNLEMTRGELNRSFFTSNVDGKFMIELPFAYAPWWIARTGRA